MDEAQERARRSQARAEQNEAFLLRLVARNPAARSKYEHLLRSVEAPTAEATLEGKFEPNLEVAGDRVDTTAREIVLETIVSEERPVLLVRDDWIDTEDATIIGIEAAELVGELGGKRSVFQPIMPLVGRIDVTSFPNSEYVGTGWCIDTDIVVTNRHVAELISRRDGRTFAFARGVAGVEMTASLNTLHEFDDMRADAARVFAIKEVLYIEPAPGPDIAFLRVRRSTDGTRPDRLDVAPADLADNKPVCVVGYPARASRRVIPDQDLMQRLYRGRYDIKRIAPGYSMPFEGKLGRHDCTSLGGNSGSPVCDMNTGEVVGLHFAGLYEEANYAVPASVLRDYVSRKAWKTPINDVGVARSEREASGSASPGQAAATSTRAGVVATTEQGRPVAIQSDGGPVTVTIPLSITVSLGQPVAPQLQPGPALGAPDPALAEAATRAFWRKRPEGVVAARVGFAEDGDAIGDTPLIVASVPLEALAEVEANGPRQFNGFEVLYRPANLTELLDSGALPESVDSIAYDDDARTGAGFSFDAVDEVMTLTAHVGPEYSWDQLHGFLAQAEGQLVSAIYEFHAPQIKDAIEARLEAGASVTLVCDNLTYSEVRDAAEEFDRVPVFKAWKEKYGERFKRVVVPEGTAGLISDAYHIKVTVRQDDTFWLSSGNWKKGSSQPVITDEQRANAADEDLPGNREWHVIIRNATLAGRFRNHIMQDFARSRALGGGEVPKANEAAELFVDVMVEEEPVAERPPPSHLLKPRHIERRLKVKPLLTPDREGAIYAEAVLELIRKARTSLLFQIPYIAMPSNPTLDRGYIDELLAALTGKLNSLKHARVLLRTGSSKFSAPTHAAWYFKSKGVDIDNRLRQIDNHHTKGMIVDGRRVLIGSHNWSKPGVSLNRDASLIFNDREVAGYFAEAFQIDWDRARPIKPKEFKKESVVLEATGDTPPPGFRRIPLSELLKEDD